MPVSWAVGDRSGSDQFRAAPMPQRRLRISAVEFQSAAGFIRLGIGDHQLHHVVRCGTHHRRHRRSKGMVASDGEDRHTQLAAYCQECLVVLRVQGECTELLERGMHGPRLGIEPRVVIARCFCRQDPDGGGAATTRY